MRNIHSSEVAMIVIGCLGSAWALYSSLIRRGKRELPPSSDCSMFTYVKNSMNPVGVEFMEFVRDICKSVESKNPALRMATFVQSAPFWDPFIITTDYKLGRLVLSGRGEENQRYEEGDKNFMYKDMFNILDHSISNMISHKTSNRNREGARKACLKAFSLTKLKQAWSRAEYALTDILDDFRAAASSTSNIILLHDRIMDLFIRLLGENTYGITFTTDGSEDDSSIDGAGYVRAQETMSRYSQQALLNPFIPLMFWTDIWRSAYTAKSELRRMSSKMLKLCRDKKTKSEEEEAVGPECVLDHIVLNPYPSELACQSDVILMAQAAHDTTAHSLSFLMMELMKPVNASVLKRLQMELDGIMPEHFRPAAYADGTNGDDIISKILNLEYLSWCVKEVLRLWPVVAGGPCRQLVEDISYGDLLIPKNSHFVVFYYAMFRHQSIDRPDEFLPERWSSSNPQLPMLNDMVMPFSIGKRACLGQNMAKFQLHVLCAYFIRYFSWELVEEPQIEFFVTLKLSYLKVAVSSR